jgi:hypothetical protein
MSNESENAKARLDRTMADMKKLQSKLDSMTPEQREKLTKLMQQHGPELREMQTKLVSVTEVLQSRKKPVQDRIAKAVLSKSTFVAQFRKQKTKREASELWGNGWLVPITYFGKRKSLMQGHGVKAFWLEMLLLSEEQNASLMIIGDAWKKTPALALPTLLTHISSLICDHFGATMQNRIMPFDAAFVILQRILIEAQLQAGVDPSTTKGLEEVGNDWILVAAGESPSGDMTELTLKAMLAFGWLASILVSTKNI